MNTDGPQNGPPTDTQTAPAKKPKPGTFQKGNPGPRGLKKVAPPAPPLPEEPDGLDDAGRFRAVWEQSPDKDQNDAQRRLRKMLADDPMAYFKMMHQLEKALGGKADENGLPPDENEDRVRKLMKELLDAADRGAKL